MSSLRAPLSLQLGSDHKRLMAFAVVAVLLEAATLFTTAWQGHWLAHPDANQGPDTTKFVEAEMFEMPSDSPHLVEEKKLAAPAPSHEASLSKVPNQGKVTKPGAEKLPDENQTQSGPKLTATHGPVALFTPSPVIPSYLRDREIKTSVVIDFFVNAQGVVDPRMVSSSGDQELDALALSTAKKWQFRPAEKEHQAVESKVRLRINFEVQ